MAISSNIPMAFRCRYRPVRLIFLCVCSLLAVFCLLRSLAQHESNDLPHIVIRRSTKTLPKASPTTKPVREIRRNITRTIHNYTKEELQSYQRETNKIPKIIHLIWKNSKIPKWSENYVRKWKLVNPDWQIWFWSDTAADRFMSEKYKEFHAMYRAYASNIQRADALRYFIMYHFGGIYADLDVEPLKPLENLRNEHACVLSTEPNAHARFCFKEKDVLALLDDRVACNAVLACRRNHPFFKYVMNMLPMVKGEKNPLHSTGPLMLTYRYIAFNYFVKNVIGGSPHRVFEKACEVYLAPDHWFLPTYDSMQEKHLKTECQKSNLSPNQNEVCDYLKSTGFSNRPRDSSLTNHHWVHTWIKGGNKHKDLATVDIKDIVPDVIFPEQVIQF